MSNTAKAFQNGKAFVAFLTGGDPSPARSLDCILAMAESGADLIEIGIPFSDPIAEGPVIQAASARALAGGMTLARIFELVEEVRRHSNIPLALMTYVNPVFQMGYDRFAGQCAVSGVDALIVPDLPLEESGDLRIETDKAGVDLIPMVAPTSGPRIRTIARTTCGFLYLVSSMGVTGVRKSFDTDFAGTMQIIREATPFPVAIGFGVSTPDQARQLASFADGIIVGSRIVRMIEESGSQASEALRQYVRSMKQAVNDGK